MEIVYKSVKDETLSSVSKVSSLWGNLLLFPWTLSSSPFSLQLFLIALWTKRLLLCKNRKVILHTVDPWSPDDAALTTHTPSSGALPRAWTIWVWQDSYTVWMCQTADAVHWLHPPPGMYSLQQCSWSVCGVPPQTMDQWVNTPLTLSQSYSLSLLQNKENQKTSLCQINFTPYWPWPPQLFFLHLSISDCIFFALRIRSPQILFVWTFQSGKL